jgi:hypothetical protein
MYRNKSLQGQIKTDEAFSVGASVKDYPEHQHNEKLSL